MNKATMESSTGIPWLDNRIMEETLKHCGDKVPFSQPLLLGEAFVWSDTPEGQKFWVLIDNHLQPTVRVTKPQMTVRELCNSKTVLRSTNRYCVGNTYRLVRVGADLFHIHKDGASQTEFWFEFTGDQTLEDLKGFEVAEK